MKRIIFLFKLTLFSLLSQAQSFTPKYIEEADEFLQSNFEIQDESGWLRTKPNVNLSVIDILNNKSSIGLGEDDYLILKSSHTDSYPFTTSENQIKHDKFVQYHNGVIVEFTDYFIHSKQGNVISMNGKLAENIVLSSTPLINESVALNLAITEIGTTHIYAWQDQATEDSLKSETGDSNATYYPDGDLVYAKIGEDTDFGGQNFILCWKFNVISLSPYQDVIIYINANTGAVLRKSENISHDGPAQLMYYGTKTIDTKPIPISQHYLKANNNTRNIHTKIFTGDLLSYSSDPNVKDSDDDWDLSDVHSTTAHWCAQMAWDYFEDEFNYTGCKNTGAELRIASKYTLYEGCAYGYFGNANKKDYIMVGTRNNNYDATLDIIGHEFNHGINTHNANMHDANESGALEESFGDIFGVLVERYVLGTYNWQIGENASLLRIMNHPSASPPASSSITGLNIAQPSVYKGSRWYTGTADNGGIHHNCSVNSYWFYLLSEGSMGAPDGTYNNISVAPIGIDKAARITFYSQHAYMPQLATYNDARLGAINAALHLYGSCTEEWKQTVNAWAAVGIGSPILPTAIDGPSTVYYWNNGTLLSGLPIELNAVGGVGNYTWMYSGPWTYNISGGKNENFHVTNLAGSYTSTTIQVNSICESVSKPINFINLNPGLDYIPNNGYGGVVLSPNPASSMIRVTADFPEEQENVPISVSILNDGGGFVFQNTYNNGVIPEINIAHLGSGMYTLIAHKGNSVGFIRFLKR